MLQQGEHPEDWEKKPKVGASTDEERRRGWGQHIPIKVMMHPVEGTAMKKSLEEP